MFLLLLCTSWIQLHHLVVVNYSHFCPFSANCPLRSIRGRLFPPLSIWSIYDHWRLLELSPTSVSILLVIIIIFVYQCCRVGSPGCLLFVLVIASDYSDYSTANYNDDDDDYDDYDDYHDDYHHDHHHWLSLVLQMVLVIDFYYSDYNAANYNNDKESDDNHCHHINHPLHHWSLIIPSDHFSIAN